MHLSNSTVTFSALLCGSTFLVAFTMVSCNSVSPTQTPPQTVPAPAPSDPQAGFKGSYTLTLQIDASCAIPEAERTRTYDARIEGNTNPAYAGYVVTLTGAPFWSSPLCTTFSGRYAGMGCNQFFASEDIDWVGFSLENNNDEAHGAHIVEHTAGGWLHIIGSTGGRISSYSFMETAGTGTIWYCPTASDFPLACSQSQYVSCQSTDLHLTLRRK
jgi:hypothetical protein